MGNLHRAIADGGPGRVRRWLTGLTDDQLGRSPQLVVASAWLSLVTGDLEAMARWHAVARAAEAATAPDDAGASFCTAPLIGPVDPGEQHPGPDNRGADYRGAVQLLAAWRGIGGMDEALQLCSDAYDALPADSSWRPAAGALSGLALALSGQPGRAVSRLRESEELAAGLGDHAAQVDCLAGLGALAFDRGLWRESEDLVLRAQDC